MVRAGSNNNGKVVGLTQTGVEHDVVVHVLGVVVEHNAHKPDLVVDDEQCGIVSINPLKLVCRN